MSDYRITCIYDDSISDLHHIGVEFNGNYYSVIFGRYINGGFFSIPNWNVGGELSQFSDLFWNTGSIGKVLKNKNAAKAIAMAISEFTEREIKE